MALIFGVLRLAYFKNLKSFKRSFLRIRTNNNLIDVLFEENWKIITTDFFEIKRKMGKECLPCSCLHADKPGRVTTLSLHSFIFYFF
ncbi:unnamed protein product [Meloidogyne enterolobii]|uniref:Uncharacterized protein n=1 Tax=Meloidogyne enterolobii TaxID=390850 RepID=A0ACB0YHR0_MELEN